MRNWKIFYTALILFLMLLNIVSPHAENSPQQNDQILKIGSMELPLWGMIDDEGRKSGVLYDFLTEIAARSGLNYEITLMPFLRTTTYLKSGEINMLISTLNEHALEAGDPLAFLWTFKYVLVAGKNSGIKSIEDLRGKNLIYVGTGTLPEINDVPEKIYRVRNFEQAIQMVERRSSIDAMVISERSYAYLLNKLRYTSEDFGTVIPLNEIREEWIFVDKNMSPEIRETLKRAIEGVKTDNVFEKLLDKYNAKK